MGSGVNLAEMQGRSRVATALATLRPVTAMVSAGNRCGAETRLGSVTTRWVGCLSIGLAAA